MHADLHLVFCYIDQIGTLLCYLQNLYKFVFAKSGIDELQPE
jgi:hypothetical protein